MNPTYPTVFQVYASDLWNFAEGTPKWKFHEFTNKHWQNPR